MRIPLPTPIPPLIHSHSKLSITCRKCSIASINSFAIVLALYSNGISHDNINVDELWLVLNVVPQRAMSIVDQFRFFDLYNSCKVECFIVDAMVHLPLIGSLGFLGHWLSSNNILCICVNVRHSC